jgi:hypothetical protein
MAAIRQEEHQMKAVTLSIPEIGMAFGTRAIIGAGVALLLAKRLDDKQQQAIGWTLAAVGALTTIPIVLELFLSGRFTSLDVQTREKLAESAI